MELFNIISEFIFQNFSKWNFVGFGGTYEDSTCFFFSFFKKNLKYKKQNCNIYDILYLTDLFKDPISPKFKNTSLDTLKDVLLKKTGTRIYKDKVLIKKKLLNGTLIRVPDFSTGDCLFTNYSFKRKTHNFSNKIDHLIKAYLRQSDIDLLENDTQNVKRLKPYTKFKRKYRRGFEFFFDSQIENKNPLDFSIDGRPNKRRRTYKLMKQRRELEKGNILKDLTKRLETYTQKEGRKKTWWEFFLLRSTELSYKDRYVKKFKIYEKSFSYKKNYPFCSATHRLYIKYKFRDYPYYADLYSINIRRKIKKLLKKIIEKNPRLKFKTRKKIRLMKSVRMMKIRDILLKRYYFSKMDHKMTKFYFQEYKMFKRNPSLYLFHVLVSTGQGDLIKLGKFRPNPSLLGEEYLKEINPHIEIEEKISKRNYLKRSVPLYFNIKFENILYKYYRK